MPPKKAGEAPKKTGVKKTTKFKAKEKEKENGTAKMKSKENTSEDDPAPLDADPCRVFQSLEEATEGGKKRLSIEQIYQKKTQLEHILLRPSTYIGSVDPHTESMWVYDSEHEEMRCKPVTYVPGLYKIFDEIVVNAADNKQRDSTMNKIKISIDQKKNEIVVWNNGKGIPVAEHKTEKMYVPEMIFGTLLTSSNYDDSNSRLTGGLNGFGAKLCNIFSKEFTVETSSKEFGKAFKQTWRDNMTTAGKPIISQSKGEDFTCVTFYPDLEKFGMDKLDDDCVALMSRRAYDLAGSTRGVSVYLNGKLLPVKGFKQYVGLYTKSKQDENGEALEVIFEQPHERWEIAVTVSEHGSFQQISFVNSIATMKGGRHVDYVSDQIVEKLLERVRAQTKKTGMNVRPSQVKNHLWLFVNCLIVNPTFDSQTKENMTLPARSFGSRFDLSDKFLTQAGKSGIMESVMDWLKGKVQQQLQKQCHSTKHSKLKGIPKLDDANDAGTKNSSACTLILTEGDSAKSLAVAGLGVVGRDRFGVFPLRGKVLNVREASYKQIMENAEINHLIKILGLQYKKSYQTADDIKSLRYGKIMIMTDQDQDGSHIKGLVINFIHHNWPSLLHHNFVEEFITPIVKVFRGKEEISFYSIPEYEEWKSQTDDWNKWKIKYYKGLGTSTSKEAQQYFSNMQRHQIKFRYDGEGDDCALDLAFSKKKVEDRKAWLTAWMEDRKRRKQESLPEVYLYERNTKSVTYKDFVDKELVLFSNMDNERSIPSLVDGLKPGQRKVMFTCFRRNDKREVKVAQLAGAVAEMSAYHHGEQSLMSTIINLAQNFVGSNNISLLMPLGQFGTRLQGGKDAASPRYLFTMLSPVTRTVFHSSDEPLLQNLYDDNKKIEPEYYVPIVPTVLINGAEGIGTGWSTKVPCYNPRDIVENIRRLIGGQEPLPMVPWYKNYRGTIVQLGPQRYIDSGEVAILDEETIEITELPHDVSTQSYKEQVLEPMLNGTEKQAPVIQDYREYHTDRTVRFVVKLSPEKLESMQQDGLHKVFKLQSTITLTSMVLFDADGCLRRFENVEDILREFYTVRQKFYEQRHSYMEGLLKAEAKRLSNQARFIMEKIGGEIIMENKKKAQIVQQLVQRKYDTDPVRKWKDMQNKKDDATEEESQDNTEDDAGPGPGKQDDPLHGYDYLVKMELIKLSEEEVQELLRKRDTKNAELEALRQKKPHELWSDDLDAFLEAMDKQDKLDMEEDESAPSSRKAASASAAGGKKAGGKKKVATMEIAATLPSSTGQRIEPIVDSATKEKYEKADKAKENRVLGVKREKKEKPEKRDGARGKKRTSDETEVVPDDEGIMRFIKKGPDAENEEPKAKKKKAAPKPKKKAEDSSDDDDDEEEKESTSEEPKPKKQKTPPKPKKKLDSSDDEDEGRNEEPKPKKQKAASKPKKKVDSSDDEEEGSDVYVVNDSDSDASFKPKKKKTTKAVKGKPTKKNTVVDSDSDNGSVKADVSNGKENVKKVDDKPVAATSRPARVRKQIVYVDSESESEDTEEPEIVSD